MRDDPIIAELRAVREAHAAKFNFDFGKISADLRARQERARQAGRTFVTLAPRPVAAWEKSAARNVESLVGA
jgi:hypothetical protein